MTFKKIFFALFLLPQILTAQKILEFPSKFEKIDAKNWLFNIDKVIDVRNAISTNYIGSIQSGLLNAKRDASLKNPLADELQVVINQMLPNVKDSMELILKINRLKVWEQTFIAKEEAYAFGDLELVMKKDTVFYLIDSYSDFVKYRSGWDVTGIHTKNIVTIVKNALMFFNKNKNWELSNINFQKLSIEDVLSKSNPQILVDDVKVKGIYRHFGEFLNNSPTMPYEYENRKGDKILVLTDENGVKKYMNHPTDVWGFCDGKQVFVSQQGDFFPIVFEGDKAKFKGYNVQNQQKRATMGFILFGGIGVAIASSNKNAEWLEINMNSGQFIPLMLKNN
jgi:hypothetical protein